jgi:hypothetical protein
MNTHVCHQMAAYPSSAHQAAHAVRFVQSNDRVKKPKVHFQLRCYFSSVQLTVDLCIHLRIYIYVSPMHALQSRCRLDDRVR